MLKQNSFSVRARTASDELFSKYDRLNDLWNQVEVRLTKYHIPRPVDFTYASYFPDAEYEHHGVERHDMLGIQKVKGEWRICLGSSDDIHPEEDNWTLVSECSALLRVQAAKHLSGLEEAIISDAEGFISIVEQAILEMSNFLDPKPSDQIRELLEERARLNGQKD